MVLQVVVRVLLCSFYGVAGVCHYVAMQFIGCCSWFSGYLHAGVRVPGCCQVVVGGCQGVAMQFIRCCRWLPLHWYVVTRVLQLIGRVFLCRCQGGLQERVVGGFQDLARVLQMVSRVFLCGCQGVVAGCHCIAMQFLWCCKQLSVSMWLLGCCGSLTGHYFPAVREQLVVAMMLLCGCQVSGSQGTCGCQGDWQGRVLVVARVLLCCCQGIFHSFQHINMQQLEYSGQLAGHSNVADGCLS